MSTVEAKAAKDAHTAWATCFVTLGQASNLETWKTVVDPDAIISEADKRLAIISANIKPCSDIIEKFIVGFDSLCAKAGKSNSSEMVEATTPETKEFKEKITKLQQQKKKLELAYQTILGKRDTTSAEKMKKEVAEKERAEAEELKRREEAEKAAAKKREEEEKAAKEAKERREKVEAYEEASRRIKEEAKRKADVAEAAKREEEEKRKKEQEAAEKSGIDDAGEFALPPPEKTEKTEEKKQPAEEKKTKKKRKRDEEKAPKKEKPKKEKKEKKDKKESKRRKTDGSDSEDNAGDMAYVESIEKKLKEYKKSAKEIEKSLPRHKNLAEFIREQEVSALGDAKARVTASLSHDCAQPISQLGAVLVARAAEKYAKSVELAKMASGY